MRTCSSIITLAALLSPTLARADAQAEAIALFDQGIKDLQAGNPAQACPLLAASLAKYPDSGTKGALAECYTQLGRIASAWQLWRELADTAPAADLRADATASAATLEPRLPRFVIKLQAPAPAGLVVTINTTTADPTISIPLPIDPGQIIATAHSPTHKEWSQTYQAIEGKVTTIEIPALVELPKLLVPKSPPSATSAAQIQTLVLREDHSGTRRTRHVIGLSVGLLGVAAVGAGAYFGSVAKANWNDAETVCGGSVDDCPSASLSQAQAKVDTTRKNAMLSTVLFGAGGAAVVIGAIVWLSAPSSETANHGVRVSASIGSQSFGFVVSGQL